MYECSKHSNKTGLQVGHLKDALVNHHEEEVHLIQQFPFKIVPARAEHLQIAQIAMVKRNMFFSRTNPTSQTSPQLFPWNETNGQMQLIQISNKSVLQQHFLDQAVDGISFDLRDGTPWYILCVQPNTVLCTHLDKLGRPKEQPSCQMSLGVSTKSNTSSIFNIRAFGKNVERINHPFPDDIFGANIICALHFPEREMFIAKIAGIAEYAWSDASMSVSSQNYVCSKAAVWPKQSCGKKLQINPTQISNVAKPDQQQVVIVVPMGQGFLVVHWAQWMEQF